MRLVNTLILLLAVPVSGCSGWEGPRPEDVPEQAVLAPQSEQVLQVTLKADSTGYSVSSMRRTSGAPTLAIDQNKDVLITATDAAGKVLSTVSVANPRIVRTAGSSRPDSAVLDEATVTVNIANPDMVSRLGVQVRQGPNEGYKQQFSVREHLSGKEG